MNSNPLEVSRINQFFDGSMRPDASFSLLANFDQLFPSRIAARGGAIRELTPHPSPFPHIQFEEHGKTCDLNDFLATNRVTGLLVLKDGKIIMEDYQLGLGPDMRWASSSVAKSIAGTLFGVALKEGKIASLDDPVAKYVPLMAGGAYAQISVGDVLTMTSGIGWDETYTNLDSERRQLVKVQTEFQPGAVLRFMNNLKPVAEPGTKFNYNTGESYVLGAIIEGAIKCPLTEYLSEKIWSRIGMEQDATWWMDSPKGMTLSGSGMTATMRDYGRFGQFVLEQGVIDGESIVPDNWFTEGAQPKTELKEGQFGYGYGWWVPPNNHPMHNGAFQAEGIYGQYIYIHPEQQMVIVLLSARSKPSAHSRLEWNDELFFATVAEKLSTL